MRAQGRHRGRSAALLGLVAVSLGTVWTASADAATKSGHIYWTHELGA